MKKILLRISVALISTVIFWWLATEAYLLFFQAGNPEYFSVQGNYLGKFLSVLFLPVIAYGVYCFMYKGKLWYLSVFPFVVFLFMLFPVFSECLSLWHRFTPDVLLNATNLRYVCFIYIGLSWLSIIIGSLFFESQKYDDDISDWEIARMESQAWLQRHKWW